MYKRFAMTLVVMFFVMLSASAKAYTPLPWDEEEPKEEPVQINNTQKPASYQKSYECVTYAFLRGAYISPEFTGSPLDGLKDGMGGGVEIPATTLVWLFYGLFNPSDLAGVMQKNAWLGGMAGRLRTAPLFDEAAFSIGYSKTAYSDTSFGGLAAYESYSVGMTLSGPAQLSRIKGTFYAGWRWGEMTFDNRNSFNLQGPTLGAGIEYRQPLSGDEVVLGFSAQLRRSWLSGIDGTNGRVEVMQDALRFVGTLYW